MENIFAVAYIRQDYTDGLSDWTWWSRAEPILAGRPTVGVLDGRGQVAGGARRFP
jgi:hypothetical protein